MTAGTILFIDAYDSFSNNITSLLREELDVRTETIRIDDPRFVLNDDAFEHFLQRFDAVVAGPGPGHPQIRQDVGLIARIWTLQDDNLIPALGICLGFQSLCVSHGAAIHRLEQPRHGLVTRIAHQSSGVFAEAQEVFATQYHSLHVVLDNSVALPVWHASEKCQDLKPLAWDLTDSQNGPLLMAVQHQQKPFVGLQFHPESICTNPEGRRLVRNWWQQACFWNVVHRGRVPTSASTAIKCSQPASCHGKTVVEYSQVDISPDLTAIDVAEHWRASDNTPIVLQSGTRNGRPVNPETGQYSIVALHDATSVHVRYDCSDRTISTTIGSSTILSKQGNISEAFTFLETFIQERRAVQGSPSIPFWGGLVGYVSYEAGLASIDVPPPPGSTKRPDVWFVYVDRSVVIDHIAGIAYVQSIRPDDRCWIDETARSFKSMYRLRMKPAPAQTSIITEPQRKKYCAKVEACQEHLRAGSSYELCLTDQTTVQSTEDSWKMYQRLSKLNPAPFGVYLELEDLRTEDVGISIVGSSPERFLSWTRDGQCQFRPIKGTVSKANSSRAEAEAVLRTQKEMAENLMIVDLIRHDLAGVNGIRNVRVPSLMVVEEYETVYQLVSVIEGDLASSCSGVSVLAASLPPGSMTGAPKRRSCELLQELENHQARGLYSGVVGYLDVGGGGDFSVVIRTAFKWKDEELWRIGAGGAVTVLSTAEGEFDEMLVKRQRLLEVLLYESGC